MNQPTHDDFNRAANTIRGLSMDAIQAAKSGHPGLPMGMADLAAVLWLKYLKHDPAKTDWADRDRFVLSGGHGSMLLYSLLHLAGYDVPMAELKRFRQLGSITPGHPEAGHTPGVETTTGPLGQGFGNAVGMAVAERMLAARFNTAEHRLQDHYTYVFCGDGDMMEGITHEAAALAGHLKLEKLIAFYDHNYITIEGRTELAHSEDVAMRFKAYGWNVMEVDGHDYDSIDRAIAEARVSRGAPVLLVCATEIGFGSPNRAGTAKAHGEPLGEDEIALTKEALGIPQEPFHVSEEVYAAFRARARECAEMSAKWERTFQAACAADAELADKWDAFLNDHLPEDLADTLPVFTAPVATRVASGTVMQELARRIPQLAGGSADLSPSTKTWLDDYPAVTAEDFSGRNFHFGVREHGMAAVLNGMALHRGFRVFGATFFVFADYLRPALRMAAITNLPIVYVFTHDSFYVGEDGPTHEPVEQIASLRCMPGVTVIRPADPSETGEAWLAALENKSGPTALLLTRHNLEVLDRAKCAPASELKRGAYTLWQSGEGDPELIIIATGSEVKLALDTAKALADVNVRVVNMPSWELFENQSREYRESVLPCGCARRMAIEAGTSFGWSRYIGAGGVALTLDRYGASGSFKDLEKEFGFTVENATAMAKSIL